MAVEYSPLLRRDTRWWVDRSGFAWACSKSLVLLFDRPHTNIDGVMSGDLFDASPSTRIQLMASLEPSEDFVPVEVTEFATSQPSHRNDFRCGVYEHEVALTSPKWPVPKQDYGLLENQNEPRSQRVCLPKKLRQFVETHFAIGDTFYVGMKVTHAQ